MAFLSNHPSHSFTELKQLNKWSSNFSPLGGYRALQRMHLSLSNMPIKPCDHVSSCIQDLYWLLVRYHAQYKSCMLMYAVHHSCIQQSFAFSHTSGWAHWVYYTVYYQWLWQHRLTQTHYQTLTVYGTIWHSLSILQLLWTPSTDI